ncbi:MAG TPA: DUF4388 domain-containing protein [Planctomycetota bacterium]|nr:DUF4388 domain-containing protein [Planctomycetota bacterium]
MAVSRGPRRSVSRSRARVRTRAKVRRAAPGRRRAKIRRATRVRGPAKTRHPVRTRRPAKARRPVRTRRPTGAKRASTRDLKGHVDLVGLGNLLQLLSMNKTEGVLRVTRAGEKQSVHLGPEGIRLLSSTVPRVRRLSKLATKLSGPTLITSERLKRLLGKEKLLGWTLGHVLFSNEGLSKERIQEALRLQVEEEILDLFVWDEALFSFEEGRPGSAALDNPLARLPIRADVTSLLLEAARRADELLQIRKTLPDDKTKVHKIECEIHADQLGEDVVRVDAILPLINGRRSLKSILQSSIYPKFATMRAIHKLLSLGYAKAHDAGGDTVLLKGDSSAPVVAIPSREDPF